MPIKHIISIKKTNSNYIRKLRYPRWRELSARDFRIYNLTNVDKSWTPNEELRDSIIGFRELAGINFMLRDTMAYDHFWSFICNGGGYKTPDGASEESAEARFKIQFNPDWNKTQEDPPKGTERKYSVEIHPSVPNNDDINETDFKEATNKPITDTKLSFADNQNNENNRKAVNSGIYEAMDFIAGKIDSLGTGEAIGEGIVKFSEGKKATTYGFDSLRYDAHKGTGLYELVTIAGKSYMTLHNPEILTTQSGHFDHPLNASEGSLCLACPNRL